MVTGLLLIMVGIVLYAYGRLPSQIAVIATGYLAIITLVAAIWERTGPSIIELWQKTPKTKVLWSSAFTVILFTVGVLIYPYLLNLNSNHSSVLANNTQKGLATIWKPLLGPLIPFCQASKGTGWYATSSGASPSCNSSAGLILQQVSALSYAEIDLGKIHGATYNGITFQVQVQIVFKNPTDTKTWAGILVEVPQAPGIKYILALNSIGQWQLQYGVDGGKIPVVEPDIPSKPIKFNSTEPIKITVRIQDGILSSDIGGTTVNSYGLCEGICNISNNSSTLIGLRVEKPNEVVSSPILYSNFELDSLGGE